MIDIVLSYNPGYISNKRKILSFQEDTDSAHGNQ